MLDDNMTARRDKLAWEMYRRGPDRELLLLAGVAGEDDAEAALLSEYVLNSDDPEDLKESGPLYLKDHVLHMIFADGYIAKAEREVRLTEAFAGLSHQQWAHWTRYILDKLEPLADFAAQHHFQPGDVAEAWSWWRKQIETPYSELSEEDKESDREWARKYLEVS